MVDTEYLETDQEVKEVADAAILYIYEGSETDLPYDLRGLGVYGVIGALRENDESFYGDGSTLDDSQRERLEEVEKVVDEAVDMRAQFYPFGHDVERFKLEDTDRDLNQLSGNHPNNRPLAIMKTSERLRQIKNYKSRLNHDPLPGPVEIKHTER